MGLGFGVSCFVSCFVCFVLVVSAIERTWMVLPRPISSHRMPCSWYVARNPSQFTPSVCAGELMRGDRFKSRVQTSEFRILGFGFGSKGALRAGIAEGKGRRVCELQMLLSLVAEMGSHFEVWDSGAKGLLGPQEFGP